MVELCVHVNLKNGKPNSRTDIVTAWPKQATDTISFWALTHFKNFYLDETVIIAIKHGKDAECLFKKKILLDLS